MLLKRNHFLPPLLLATSPLVVTTVAIDAPSSLSSSITAIQHDVVKSNLRHSDKQQQQRRRQQQLEVVQIHLNKREEEEQRNTRRRQLGGRRSTKSSKKSKSQKATKSYNYSRQSRDDNDDYYGYNSGDNVSGNVGLASYGFEAAEDASTVGMIQAEVTDIPFDNDDGNIQHEEDSSGIKGSGGGDTTGDGDDLSLHQIDLPVVGDSTSESSSSGPSSLQDQDGEGATTTSSSSANSNQQSQVATPNETVLEQKLTTDSTTTESTFNDEGITSLPTTLNTTTSNNENDVNTTRQIQLNKNSKSMAGIIASLAVGSVAFLTLGLFVHSKQKGKQEAAAAAAAAATTSNSNVLQVIDDDDISSIWSANEEEDNNIISSEGGGATPEIGRVSSLAAMGAASPLAVLLSGQNSQFLVDEDAPVSDLISYWESKEH